MVNQPDTKPDDSGQTDIYPLAPPESQLADRQPALFGGPVENFEGRGRRRRRFQFTLGESLMLMVAACLVLSVLGWLPGGYGPVKVAGLAGIGTLLGLVAQSAFRVRRPILHVAWWALLLLYLGSCVAAILSDR